jgi:hypothetical protein
MRDVSPPLSPEKLLLRNFVANLPTHSPSPFKTPEIFVDCPTQKRTLVEKLVTLREPDGHRWQEIGLVYDEEPKYRAHCVMAGSSKVVLDDKGHSTVEGLCTVWTRKYPKGWQGIWLNEAGTLVNTTVFVSKSPKKTGKLEGTTDILVWSYSTAVCVDVNGIETSIECPVPMKVVEYEGVTYDLEPGWEDVVNALRKECSIWAQKECVVQQQARIESRSPPKKSPRKTQKGTPKQSRKDKQSMNSPQQPSPLHNVVSRFSNQESTFIVTPVNANQGGDMILPNNENQEKSTVHHDSVLVMNAEVPVLLGHDHGAVIQSDLQPQDAVDKAGPRSQRPAAVPQAAHAQKNNEASDAPSIQAPWDLSQSPVPQPPKPKRRCASTKKQTASKQELQEPSGEAIHTTACETPPSTGKAGTKRKKPSGTRTPAKKRATAKTSPVEPVPDMQDNHPSRAQCAGLSQALPAPPAFQMQQQMAFTHSVQAYHGLPRDFPETPMHPWNNQGGGRLTNPLYSADAEYSGYGSYIQNDHNSTSGTYGDSEGSRRLSISQKLQSIDEKRVALLESYKSITAFEDMLKLQRKQADLDKERTRLINEEGAKAMTENQFPMYHSNNDVLQPAYDPQMSGMQWKNGLQPDYSQMSQMSKAQQDNDPQSMYQMFGVHSNIGTQPNPYQIFAAQQNDHSLHSHSQVSSTGWGNISERNLVPGSHLRQSSSGYPNSIAISRNESWETPGSGSFNQAGIFQDGSQMYPSYSTDFDMFSLNATPSNVLQRVAPNPNNRQFSNTAQQVASQTSTTEDAFAGFSNDSVVQARASVESVMGLSLAEQQERVLQGIGAQTQ